MLQKSGQITGCTYRVPRYAKYTQIIWEIALFFGKIYTAGTNFTRPPVATNFNSDSTLAGPYYYSIKLLSLWTRVQSYWWSFSFLLCIVLSVWGWIKSRWLARTLAGIQPWQTVLSIFSFDTQKFGWQTVMEQAECPYWPLNKIWTKSASIFFTFS